MQARVAASLTSSKVERVTLEIREIDEGECGFMRRLQNDAGRGCSFERLLPSLGA